MTASLAACAAKLDRASEHLVELRAEQAAYFSAEPITLDSYFEEQTGWWVFTAYCSGISLRYSTIVGDVVHNLRSALDQLVCQLVIANSATPTRSHQFPITTSPTAFAKAAAAMLVDVDPEHRALIEAAQPYTERDDGSKRPHALVVLNDLSNRDKHRLVNAVQLVAGSEHGIPIEFGSNDDAGPIGEVRVVSSRSIENGGEFARVHVEPRGPSPEVVVMRGCIPVEIVLVEWGLPVITTVTAVAQQVARILDHAEPVTNAARSGGAEPA